MGGLDLSRTLRHRGLENGNFRLNLTSGTCVRLTGLYLFTLILLQLYLLRLQTRLSFDRLQTCLRKGKKNLQKKKVSLVWFSSIKPQIPVKNIFRRHPWFWLLFHRLLFYLATRGHCFAARVSAPKFEKILSKRKRTIYTNHSISLIFMSSNWYFFFCRATQNVFASLHR